MDEYVNVLCFSAGSQSPPLHADFSLDVWNDHWIMSLEDVRCRYCLAPQWPSNTQDPVHLCPGCELSQARYPLRNLAKIVAGLPMVPA